MDKWKKARLPGYKNVDNMLINKWTECL